MVTVLSDASNGWGKRADDHKMHGVNLTEPFTGCIVLLLIRTFTRIGFQVLDVSSDNLLHSVLQTLVYADIFDYPLTAQEVYRYLTSGGASAEEVAGVLSNKTFFTRVGDYFTLHGREKIVETRKRRATIAAQLWPKAVRYGRIIARLPFVRMITVTGSLAMNNTQEEQDIDYMIVTAPGHLWTCRALSLLVARWAELEGVKLCPNYLVTTNALAFKERSLYVAHELTQMVPLS